MPSHQAKREIWRVANEKGQAADALWQSGLRGAALEQAIDALLWTDRYQALVEQPQQEKAGSSIHSLPPSQPVLDLLATQKLAIPPSPLELADLGRPQQRRLFAAARKLQKHRLRPVPPPTAEHKCIERIVLATAVLAVLFVGGWWYQRHANQPHAQASDSFGKQYGPEAIVDGRWNKRHTEWLLPNKTLGWIEIIQPETKQLAVLRIRNAFHPPHNSYGTKELRIEVFEGNKLVFTKDTVFERHDKSHAWLEVDVGRSANRARLHAISYYEQGAGLSEVEWIAKP